MSLIPPGWIGSCTPTCRCRVTFLRRSRKRLGPRNPGLSRPGLDHLSDDAAGVAEQLAHGLAGGVGAAGADRDQDALVAGQGAPDIALLARGVAEHAAERGFDDQAE